jgi:adenylosuccinate lyase
MQLSTLTAISPIDGRYRKQVAELATYFSEFGLIKYRVQVEVEYFIKLALHPLPSLQGTLTDEKIAQLRNIYIGFGEADALEIKETEKTTNHDVKAVEYFVKKKLDELGLSEVKEFIHFGLTSQDINNTAIPLSFKEAFNNVYKKELETVIDMLHSLSANWASIPMLARTHGQPASPTMLGKEIYVFVDRLKAQFELLLQIPIPAKFGGATGNFNAHVVAYPEIHWPNFANDFVNNELGLHRSQHTTQIEHYDHFAAWFDNLKRINTIMIDLCQDIWLYVSMDYFKQRLKEGEVGSSAMPHKVNPIDFENAEGNLGLANAIYEFLSRKLPVSRLQRDLTDSTVLRNIGVPLSHSLIALKSLQRGLGKLILNEDKIKADLQSNWAVVAEAIQTVLRREGYPQPYEALKALTRTNAAITKESIHTFIEELVVSDAIKQELKSISPDNYTGVFLG